MKLIVPDSDYSGVVDLFVAGGISNCPDWQSDVVDMFSETDLILANPRKYKKVAKIGTEASAQIAWEHLSLSNAETVMFWFPEETLCPITLFELGVQVGSLEKKLFVGTHPNYARRFDVIEQLKLARTVAGDRAGNIPMVVHSSIEDLVKEIKGYHSK